MSEKLEWGLTDDPEAPEHIWSAKMGVRLIQDSVGQLTVNGVLLAEAIHPIRFEAWGMSEETHNAVLRALAGRNSDE